MRLKPFQLTIETRIRANSACAARMEACNNSRPGHCGITCYLRRCVLQLAIHVNASSVVTKSDEK